MSSEKSGNCTFLVPALPALERCVLETYIKTLAWKSKIKNVVKYDAYLDILLVGSIYVTTYRFVKEKKQIPVMLQTPSSRLRHRHV